MSNKREWETYIYSLCENSIPRNIKPANFKAVALAFGYHSDWNTLENMSASMVTIAVETSLHRNTVDKVVAAMVAMGLASQRDSKRSWGKKKWTYVYDLSIPNDSHLSVSPSLEAEPNDSHSSVNPSLDNDSHSEQRLTFAGNDSHSESNDSHLSVNNHTYNHTYNHKKDDGPARGAEAPQAVPSVKETLSSKEMCAQVSLANRTSAPDSMDTDNPSLANRTDAADSMDQSNHGLDKKTDAADSKVNAAGKVKTIDAAGMTKKNAGITLCPTCLKEWLLMKDNGKPVAFCQNRSCSEYDTVQEGKLAA